jgi:anti-repressor protein
MNDLTIFNYDKSEVRTTIVNGDPWFVAKDVAEALGYKWNGNKTIGHIPEEWGGVESISTPSGNQEIIIISEPGLFFFLNRSDKKSALPMQKWVAGKVLPSIRKTGAYSQAAPPQFQIPGNLPEALRLAADLAEKNNKLTEKISTDRPKVEFATAIEDSKKSIKIGDFAKLLNNAGLKIGRNRLFEWLREKRYLMPNNEPYQNHIDSRLFSVIEKTRESDNGPVPYIQSMITGKGQIALTKKIIEHFNPIIGFGNESRA